MKKIITLLLSLSILCLAFSGMSISVFAATPTADAAFTYSDVAGGISITGVDTTTYGTDIVVPSKIGGKDVLGIEFHDEGLTSLDASSCLKLLKLECYYTDISGVNQLTTLDVSKNTELTDLSCGGNALTALNVSKNTKLTGLFCGRNQLTTLDVSKNTALIYLDCIENLLTALDISNNTKLLYLGCSSNQLTTLDVSKNTELNCLNSNDNYIADLSPLQGWKNISGHYGTISPQKSGTPPVISTLVNATSPKTGDTSPALLVTVALISVLVLVPKKKKIQ